MWAKSTGVGLCTRWMAILVVWQYWWRCSQCLWWEYSSGNILSYLHFGEHLGTVKNPLWDLCARWCHNLLTWQAYPNLNMTFCSQSYVSQSSENGAHFFLQINFHTKGGHLILCSIGLPYSPHSTGPAGVKLCWVWEAFIVWCGEIPVILSHGKTCGKEAMDDGQRQPGMEQRDEEP